MTNPSFAPELSVVIPVLNEERCIEQTLARLDAQDTIDEIVVVDNGSTDRTREIVGRYATAHPKVVLIEEPERGVARARNTGFDAARGDFIGRTDADSLVAPDWGTVVREHFASNSDIAGLTGLAAYHDSPVPYFQRLNHRLLIRLGLIGGRTGNMYGPNMALRRTTWEAVRADTKTRPGVIDDLDLALCLLNKGMHIEQPLNLRATTSARRRRTTPAKFWKLQRAGMRTFTDQGHRLLPIHRIWMACSMIGHTLQWPIYRFWDFDRRRFSLRPGAERMFPLGD